MFNKIISLLNKRFKKNLNIYNSEVYKNGLRILLLDYKNQLEKEAVSESTTNKIKNINFHLKVLNEEGVN